MKILHVITSLHTGGAEKLMVDLIPRLCENGIEADLCIFNGKKTLFYEELRRKGINIIDFGEENSVYNVMNIWRLHKLMKRYDVIHTHNTSPQLFAVIANKWLNKKLITTEHNTTNRRRKWIGYVALDRWMYNHYSQIICISKKAEEKLRCYLGRSNAEILTINNGIDITNFASTEDSPELDTYDRTSRKIIMVAGFRAQKDQDTLIRAMKILPSNFHLFLVGDGVRRQELEMLSSEPCLSKRVHFLGIRADVPALLHAADYIVMSSHYEGLSLSSIEGMCVGKPFLASNVDGLREVVQGAGILFPQGDSETLANEILNLESCPEQYNAVAGACHDRACAFDISRMVAKYIEVYVGRK